MNSYRRLLLMALAPMLLPAQIASFKVTETAGLRRFGFPVRVTFVSAQGGLQLLEGDKPIPAQFTPLEGGDMDVDFNVSLGPWESREYKVQTGAAGSSKPGEGVSIQQAGGAFAIHHSNGMEFDVPDHLTGLLNQVKTSKLSYFRTGSEGLLLNYKSKADQAEYRVGSNPKATIVKRGPLVCAVRFESKEGPTDNHAVKSVVLLEFPRSKSWMEATWTVEDPDNAVTGMTVDLNLLIEGGTAVVDLGANDTVYDVLRPDQRITLSAVPPNPGNPRWFVNLNNEPYAKGMALPAEGWAHVMDKQRATAVAVANFGDLANDSIDVFADGRLRIHRDFLTSAERTLHFWLHFVGMPVQLGAATSPQAMQNPLRIDWH